MLISGSSIRQERTRKAWSQAELAAKAGVDVRTIQRLERTGQTSFATLQAVSRALDKDVGVLIDVVPATSPSAAKWLAPRTSPRREAVFKILYALALLGTIRVGLFEFGDSGNWPHWQIFFLASVVAVALLVYGYRSRDLRAFGVVTLAAAVSLLWYFPLVLPAAVFLVAACLVLALAPRVDASTLRTRER